MHLLSAQAGAIQQEGEAIDLDQRPGALVFASSADSELAMLAGAADRAGENDLRLANTLRLSNNLSVDRWLEKTVAHARVVVLRLIGGAAYFQYGVDEITALCANRRIPLVLLPGDANPDTILQSRSTVHPDDWTRLHSLFIAGGPDNADTILQAFACLISSSSGRADHAVRKGKKVDQHEADQGEGMLSALAPKAFARFGLWHPQTGMTDEAGLRRIHERPHGPAKTSSFDELGVRSTGAYVPILFYRAALEGAGTDTIAALIAELEARGLAAIPLLVSSLKEAPCIRFVQQALAAFPPSAIFNLTGFALSIDGLDDKSNPFSGCDAPVIQLIQSGRSEAQWSADSQGLSSKDMAMFLVMPEVDGRLGGLIVGHKADAVWHERCQVPLTSYTPDASGISRAVTLAKNWSTLRATPRPERKVAVVLANYPIRDGRLANGVGYDAPESTVRMLQALQTAGYDLSSALSLAERSAAQPPGEGALPSTGAALIAQLQAGPTNANPLRGSSPARLPLARYRALFATLPTKIQHDVTARWGDPATDPFMREDGFHLPVLIFGNAAVLLQPARGYQLDETLSYHDPALVPPHAYLAAYLWLRHEFGAHALVHNGKMARWNGCLARRRRWMKPATLTHSGASCRISTPSSSTTLAKVRRPSGGAAPSSSIISCRP